MKNHSMKNQMIIVTSALLLLPAALVAQTGAETSASTSVEVTARAGLPVEPVIQAIEEGRARGASEAEIDRASLTVQQRLSASREALRSEQASEPTSAEITAGAEAMLSGARTSDLARIRAAAPEGRSVARALTVLASLSAQGAAPNEASAEIAGRLRNGVSDDGIAALATDTGGALRLDQTIGSVRADGALDAALGGGLLESTTSVGASIRGTLMGGL